jgi:hypothetical protein
MDEKLLVIILLIVIIIYFMYNYDIHLTKKNQKITEQIFVENKIDNSIMNKNNEILVDLKKNDVINKIIKILENIPTDFTQAQMLYIIKTHNDIYQNTKNIKKYNELLTNYNSDKLMQTKYSKLIQNLFIKFDNEYKKIIKSLKKVSFKE